MKRLGEALNADALPRPTATELDPEASQPDVCPICQGAGWLRQNVPVAHPLFGKAIPCDCLQAETARLLAEKLRRLSALDAFQNLSFDNFDAKVAGVGDAFDEARRFAQDSSDARWLLLAGLPGCGKTHLAAAIANEALRRGRPVLFAVVPDLLDHLRSTFAPASPIQYDEMFEGVRMTEILVLDDLGTESATPWAQEKLFQIINYRYNNQMPTVFTTNRRVETLDERIRSRLGDQVLCRRLDLSATDYRGLKKGQRRLTAPGRGYGTDRHR